MQANQSITTLVKSLWHHISPRGRGQFGLILVLMLLAWFAEILSIGAVLPFLAISTVPERVSEHSAAQPIVRALRKESKIRLLPMQVEDVLRTYADVKSPVRNTHFNPDTEPRVRIDCWAKW